MVGMSGHAPVIWQATRPSGEWGQTGGSTLSRHFLTQYYLGEIMSYWSDLAHLCEIGELAENEAENRLADHIDDLQDEAEIDITPDDIEAWRESYARLYAHIEDRVREAHPG